MKCFFTLALCSSYWLNAIAAQETEIKPDAEPLATPLASELANDFATDSLDWPIFEHPATVERRIIGFTEPADDLMLAAEFPGRISKISLTEGEPIAGASDQWSLAVTLDDGLLQKQHSQLQQQVLIAQAAIAQQQALLAQAEHQAAFQASEAQRIQALVTQQQVSQQQFDNAQFIAEQAGLSRTVSDYALKASMAQAADISAQLAVLEEQIERHRVSAPNGWLVREIMKEPGSMVQVGETIAHLVNTQTWRIDVPLSAAELASLTQVSSLSLRCLDRFNTSGHPLTIAATIHRIDPIADPITRKRLVELQVQTSDLPQAGGGLRMELILISLTVTVAYAYQPHIWANA